MTAPKPDELRAVLLNGSLPCDRLAKVVHRRRADVLAALRAHPQFERVGRRRNSRWRVVTVATQSLTSHELAERLGLTEPTVANWLRAWEAEGVTVREGAGWRLSPHADASFGWGLREFDGLDDA